MAKIRKIYDQTIKPDGSKTTIYPITSTRAVYTPEGETLDSYIKDGYFHGADLAGYKVVYELSELPLEETTFGYLMDSNLYVWVGTNGDTLDGKYQNCGPFKGPRGYDGHDGRDGRDGEPGIQGIQGPQGPAGLTGPKGAKGDKGDSGVTLGDVALTTDLDETETGKALDASAMQTIPSMVDAEEEIEEVPSNYYTRTQVDALIDAQRAARQQKENAQDAEISNFVNTVTDIVNSYKPVEIYGNVTNAPDGEDLTSVNGRLKFANRPSLNGMGYYILRRDKSFEEQVINTNTIYEIRYDFDLSNQAITLPKNVIFNFTGGKISNGTLTGNHTTFNLDVTYQIFDNVEFSGFDIPFIDIRWLGAVPDFDESSQIGTDNSAYLEEAITLAGKYYAGTGIRIVGRYMLSTAITTEYDVNIFGYHNNSRRLLVSQPNPSSPSLLFIGANITAITMKGQGEQAKSSNISLHNLKVWGPSTSTFINYTCSGAPGRVSIIEECEFRGLGIVLKLTNSGRDTMLGNLTIDKCNVWYCGQFVVAKSSNFNRTFCNLIVQNSNIEQGSSKQFELENVFGPVIITNNIIENLADAFYITGLHGDIYITKNYFELLTGTAFNITQGNLNGIVDFAGNFYNEKLKFNLTLSTIANLDFSWVKDDSSFRMCSFLKTCIKTYAFQLSWINLYCLFEETSTYDGVQTGSTGFGPLNTTIGKYVAREIGNSEYVSTKSKQYDSMPEAADYFAFISGAGNLTIGLGVGGSATYNLVYGKLGYLIIYTQLPYSTGSNILYMKGSSAGSSITPVQILSVTDKLSDIKIPTTDSIIPASTSYLPTFTKPIGYAVFDTTRGKLIVWNGTTWINADGTPLT